MTAPKDRAPWHENIQSGNRLLAKGRAFDALAAYDRALTLIDHLIASSSIDVALLISKVITHHQRAVTLTKLGHYDAADAAFRQGHAFAESIAAESSFPANLRQAAACHYRMIDSEWQVFRGEWGERLSKASNPGFNACISAGATEARAIVH